MTLVRAPTDPRVSPLRRAYRDLPPSGDAEGKAARLLLHRIDLKQRVTRG